MVEEKNKTEMLSIVVPIFNEEKTIKIFYETVENVKKDLQNISISYIFVDDGSSDNSLNVLKSLSEKNQRVHFLSFSRHFGKEAALYAGLQHSKGDYVVVMDVDLQDPPELLSEMLQMLREKKLDIIGTVRIDRNGELKVRSFFSKIFYYLMNKFSQTHLIAGVRDYRMLTQKAVKAVLLLSENQRFSKGIFDWIGFNTEYITYKNRERSAGTTSWSILSLFRYAISGIISFSTWPLMLVTILGILSFVASVFAGIFIVFRALISNTSVAGWPSMVTIILFIGGIQLLSLGIIGRYIAAIFLETKKRPIYILKEEK